MRIALAVSMILVAVGVASAQTSPRPYIADISPKAVTPTTGSFTLTVRGTGMIDGVSQISWNGVPLAGTTCTAASSPNMASCSATVPAASIALGTMSVTVANPGATLPIVSNSVLVAVNAPMAPTFCNSSDTSVCPMVRTSIVGNNPEQMISADFNNDGHTDLALTHGFGSFITVLIGDGRGAFTSLPLTTAGEMSAVAAADLDEDGNTDIAAVGGGLLTVYRGNGDGTFTSGATKTVVSYPWQIGLVAADFNNDGHLDLAAQSRNPTTRALGIQSYLGDGLGNLSDAGLLEGPPGDLSASAMVAGDFDSDGILDLLAVYNPGKAMLAKGNGAGGFTAGWTVQFGSAAPPDLLTTGDFNSDGRLDFAVVNTSFQVFIGDGQGSFTLSSQSPLPNQVNQQRSLSAIDADGDGRLDLVTVGAGANGLPSLSAYYGDGTGNFSSAIVRDSLPYLTTAAGLIDLNGDGRLDLVAASTVPASPIATGQVMAVLQYPVGSISPSSLEFGEQLYLTASSARTVTVSAGGTAPLALSAISFEDITDFAVSGGTCVVGVLIAPGGQCTIEVTFTPQAVANRFGRLNVVDNSYHRTGGVQRRTGLWGYSQPRASTTYSNSPPPMLIGSTVFPVQLENIGTGPAKMTFEDVNTYQGVQISLGSGDCPVSPALLLPGASCTYEVHVTADHGGFVHVSWRVFDNPAPGTKNSFSSGNLSVRAYSGAIVVSATELTFDPLVIHTSATKSITVTNTATSPLYFYSVGTTSNPGWNDFAVANTSTCGTTLPASSSCRVDVTFTPETTHERVGWLTLETSAVDILPTSVDLSGVGIANPRPFITAPLSPSAIAPGAGAVPLVVRGAGFVNGSVIRFNGTALTTVFVNATHLTATIPGTLLATPKTAKVTVVNPAPGGGESAPADLPIATAVNSPTYLRNDISVGTAPESLAVADFNADGYPDVAVANCGANRGPVGALPSTCPSGADVAILLGSASGDLSAPDVVPVPGTTADGIVAGDFTGDGKLDLAVSHWVDRKITLLIGDGSGNFAASADSPIDVYEWTGACALGALSSGDFNGDGTLDLVVLDHPDCQSMYVLPSSGGTISKIPFGWGYSGSTELAVNDFNRDGHLDLVTPIPYVLNINPNDGAGNLSWIFPEVGGANPGGIAVADFNGDGNPDVAIGDRANSSVLIALGDGDYGFTEAGTFNTGNAPRSMTVGDVNNDGAVDLIVVNEDDDTVTILLGDGAGNFAAAGSAEAVGAGPVALASVDVDGDGRLDLITVNREAGTISVLRQENPAVETSTTITSRTPNPSAPGQSVVTQFAVSSVPTAQGSVTLTASTGETCSGNLSGGLGSCSMTFATAGARTITATYAGHGNHLPSTSIAVTQTVNGPVATLSADGDFGVVYLDDKATRSFVLRNTGNASMKVTDIAIVAPGNALTDYTKRPPACPASLAPGASCTINIQLDPRAIGARAATLRVTTTALGSPHTVALSAMVVNPKLNLAPGKMDFGKQKVGTVSASRTINLTNNGTTTLTLGTIGVAGDFAIAAGTTCTAGASLAPNATCKINVTFSPAIRGASSGSLTVTSDARNSPQTVALSGSGS